MILIKLFLFIESLSILKIIGFGKSIQYILAASRPDVVVKNGNKHCNRTIMLL